jgi:hypothetical protein
MGMPGSCRRCCAGTWSRWPGGPRCWPIGKRCLVGRTVLRRGLSPLAVTICTPQAAPVLARVRLRARRAGSAKNAASMLTEATFSVAIARNSCMDAAIASIPHDAFVPVQHPGAVTDPNTGELICDAQVPEVAYTAFAEEKYKITGRLVVRRVLHANTQDPLFPLWRNHPFFTNNTEPVDQADITHPRRHLPQPAPRRRHPHRHHPLHRRPRRHPARTPHQPPGPPRPTPTATRAAPTRAPTHSQGLARLLQGRFVT